MTASKNSGTKSGNIAPNIWRFRRKIVILQLEYIYNEDMAQIEHITIKNASRKVLDKMRQIGQKKAERLQNVQDRWDAGEYNHLEVVQL